MLLVRCRRAQTELKVNRQISNHRPKDTDQQLSFPLTPHLRRKTKNNYNNYNNIKRNSKYSSSTVHISYKKFAQSSVRRLQDGIQSDASLLMLCH